MKPTYKEYIQDRLKQSRIDLENLELDYMKFFAGYEAEKRMLIKNIYSLEKQLEV